MKLSVKHKNLLKNYFSDKPVNKAFLFGSYSREEANKSSDIDILVELDYTQQIGMKFFDYQQELEKMLNMKVDLVTSNGLSKYILPIINREKVLIYERGTF